MKEILKHLVENVTLPEDTYLDQDEEILDFFVEELEDIFEQLQISLDLWQKEASKDAELVNVRRYFHTLKGSGRMVGAKSSGELAWTVEDTLNRVIANNLELNTEIQQYVSTVFNIYKFKLFSEFLNKLPHHLNLAPLVLLGQQLQQKISLEPALEDLLSLATTLNSADVVTGLEIASVEVVAPTESTEVEAIVAQESVHVDAVATTDENFNSETLAIFVEESEEHLATINEFLHLEQHTPDQYNRLIRALHTLRGSSSMAHVDDVFEASSKVEHLFKVLVQEDTESSKNENTLLTHYAEFVSDYLHILKQKGGESSELHNIYQKFNDAWDRYDFQHQYQQDQDSQVGLVTQLVDLEIDLLLDAEFEFDKRAPVEHPVYFQSLSQQTQLLIEHTNNRASQGIHDFSVQLKEAYERVIANPALLNTDYAYEIFDKVHQEFIHLFDTLASGQRVSLTDEVKETLVELHDYLLQEIDVNVELDAVESMQPEVATQPSGSIESAGRYVFAEINKDKQSIDSDLSQREFDMDVLDIFIEEADELSDGMDQDLNTWSENPGDTTALNNLMRYLHTLKGGANMVQANNIGLIAHELETIYERIIKGQLQATPQIIESIRLIQDDIADRIQLIREKSIDYPADHILAVLKNIDQQRPAESTSAYDESDTAKQQFVNDSADVEEIEHVEDDIVTAIEHIAENDHVAESIQVVDVESLFDSSSDLDPADIVARETFIEEARELIDDGLKNLSQWFEQRSNRSLLLQLQRIAHSLKGGAKMVHLEQVAEIAYELENAFEQFGLHNFNSNVYDGLLERTFRWLDAAIFKRDYENFDGLKSNLHGIEYVDVSAQLPEKLARTNLLFEQASNEFVQGDGTEPPSMLGEWDQSEKAEASNEMIRISADLVEKMIDLSGENAINRSRIEMDLGQLGTTLTDMELAIQRLADQLRRMEGELESQIIAKHGDFNSRYTDFDPLEMDQYSSLNQLSKSLAESASDLVDFKTTLSDKIRDTEGLLLQQSRIQAEIQESLMRTRLVPFSRLLPRLQRLVRQTASTVNKPTELLVNNTEGELDRNILEKLVSPLEHMLRNAIDHGIEDTEQRQKLGKSLTGRIELNISRQGTDVLVSFNDDGKGIDPDVIRAKAREKGLLKADQQLEPNEILQFIFHPGFSTAQQVTQISGRGVGLDVVQSEIKSLGGQVVVSSELGKGSTFTIRVPTTVAVSDALMVKVGDQQFAVPLSQIDRIVRISPTALEEYFETQNDYFDIDFQSYKLRYLGEFTANQKTPRLHGIAHSLPVLLIKGNMGQSIAILVDQLIGSRSQIVVKPIGKQFAAINAIAGATILGDGQVCLILDGQNIARQVQSSTRGGAEQLQQDKQRHRDQRRLIMIVDDSVTVRKVTTRLLERQGFDVITAKDGVDAIEQLENVKPDLMLLDIEMPRMDGFEVTNLVRHHEVHRDLPIIMITSRTGEKHRERAFSLGVTNYMGKPFQEADLLQNIDALLTVK
ncbi:hybrid sensor histidine kinase/response regulator [Acinetobacter sp. WCHAc060033]|uniref:hybrid sensor histidine kinase/response regulator n=1 Tax=Acinetobacter sp. WCHAc060033 TaxID=2518624 RepID=UPI0010234988|nr:Hpt domain-containing protein [Acinetobacter sp. WCHAc060033]RZG80121.1 hybrid sensor histidine kinase/response regulator [Acinetobacter sp. WCHAc060033]